MLRKCRFRAPVLAESRATRYRDHADRPLLLRQRTTAAAGAIDRTPIARRRRGPSSSRHKGAERRCRGAFEDDGRRWPLLLHHGEPGHGHRSASTMETTPEPARLLVPQNSGFVSAPVAERVRHHRLEEPGRRSLEERTPSLGDGARRQRPWLERHELRPVAAAAVQYACHIVLSASRYPLCCRRPVIAALDALLRPASRAAWLRPTAATSASSPDHGAGGNLLDCREARARAWSRSAPRCRRSSLGVVGGKKYFNTTPPGCAVTYDRDRARDGRGRRPPSSATARLAQGHRHPAVLPLRDPGRPDAAHLQAYAWTSRVRQRPSAAVHPRWRSSERASASRTRPASRRRTRPTPTCSARPTRRKIWSGLIVDAHCRADHPIAAAGGPDQRAFARAYGNAGFVRAEVDETLPRFRSRGSTSPIVSAGSSCAAPRIPRPGGRERGGGRQVLDSETLTLGTDRSAPSGRVAADSAERDWPTAYHQAVAARDRAVIEGAR